MSSASKQGLTPTSTKTKVIICAMVKIRVFFGMVIPPFNRNPYNGYINPYYWVDDHPLLYGNNGSLDPGTFEFQVCLPAEQ